MSENSSAGRPRESVPAREAFFDNAKFLAIVLVAVGHSWEPLQNGSRTVDAAYMAVYTFHMPAFIIVSGYFSRGFDARPGRLGRLVSGVAVPYVVFETGYALFERWAGDDPSNPVTLLDPWFLTWFLPALFVWRLTTPLWRTLRAPMVPALALAALASMSPELGDDLDLQRVLQFLPFFVLGLLLRPEHLARLRGRRLRTAAPAVFAAALLVAYWAAPRMNYEWFYHDNSAQELGAPWWAGPAMTAGLLVCSLTLTACFLAWVPRRRTWFTGLGTGTMYGYLLHGFLVKGALYAGWYDHPWVHGPLGEVTVTLAAAVAVALLCTPPVRRVFRAVVEPKLTWAFSRAARTPAAGRTAGSATDDPASRGSTADDPAFHHGSGLPRVHHG
ncbi:membrane protein [Streptomyces sulfonofaciens]|uniref:Membrane protein n=1 Tax=Streptomyces sulfonofaciens TaxID=68272 RepID=A0A919KZD2_9ACTN|nr:acyltransferase family protein [Streptomyces sulfonofaciens]GHH79075.1 membrane protein [Streptomyces sulfonofaciens]